MRFRKYDPTDIHHALYAATSTAREMDEKVATNDWVAAQALFCPYYCTLEGTLGADWGVILNPESAKFACLVFEHEWCGCPSSKHELGEWFADHGSGDQRTDEWAVPPSRRRINRRMKALRKRREKSAS